MPQNPKKTKGEILLELESIKGLLIEEDDIPILQEVDDHEQEKYNHQTPQPSGTQTSIFDALDETLTIDDKTLTFSDLSHQSIPKAMGENPFLPQHIRDRLQGNNPPPIFDFDMNQKMSSHLTSHKIHTQNRHDLVNDLIKRYLPQIEQDLRLKLLAMTEDELKKL